MPAAIARPPLSLAIAVAGAGAVGVALIALAIASAAAGHGTFSGGIAVAVAAYGALMLAAAWALWRRSLFGRGPVLALSLLNVAAGFTLTDAPWWVWLGAAVSGVTVVAAALPSTSRALHVGRRKEPEVSGADAPPRRDDPGT